jgi:DNA-binding MarR family transcriptional regulator
LNQIHHAIIQPMSAASTTRSPSPHGTLAWLAVVRAYNLCDAVMSARLAALGLRVGEHEVLAHLATAPGITQQALAARCFVAKSGVSMLLTQMQAQGLVRRETDAQDARVWRLFLTPDGAALARATMKIQAEVIGAMAAGVSDADMGTVARVMDGVSAALEALRTPPTSPARAAPRARVKAAAARSR